MRVACNKRNEQHTNSQKRVQKRQAPTSEANLLVPLGHQHKAGGALAPVPLLFTCVKSSPNRSSRVLFRRFSVCALRRAPPFVPALSVRPPEHSPPWWRVVLCVQCVCPCLQHALFFVVAKVCARCKMGQRAERSRFLQLRQENAKPSSESISLLASHHDCW